MGRARAIALLLFLFSSAAAFGQTADTMGAAPSREQVLKFMEVLHLRSQLTQYFDVMGKEGKLAAEEAFRQKVPDATPAQMAAVDEFAEKLFKEMPVDEMIEAMVPIYQKHLTQEDLDGILAFYASPVGQKLQREQPAMMQEGMKVGGEIGRKRVGSVMQQIDDFISRLAEEQQKSPKK